MAEEDLLAHLDTAAAGTGAAPASSGKKPIIIVVVILAVLALAGGGYFGYKTYMAKKQGGEEATAVEGAKEKGAEEAGKEGAKGKEAGGKIEEPAAGIMFPLEPFIVNLAGSEGKRFLKVSITLELSSPGLRTEINENLQKVTDSILILLSSKNFEDVYSIQGKFKLKDEITTRVNRFLLLGHVKDAYFTEFVIQ